MTASEVKRWRIRVSGVVQGVGFRPFTHALAEDLGVVGFVGNDPGGVFIEAQAPESALEHFVERLRNEAPRLAVVDSIRSRPIAIVPANNDFVIARSQSARDADVVLLPPDTAMCSDCRGEVFDDTDRRAGYPFTACTNCGPRFTIVKGIPYDRPNTTMAAFPLCNACQSEYDDLRDRRFHAQPTACPDCGPHLRYVDREVDVTGDSGAIAVAAALIADGRIIAIKGIGGYHLACDATNARAVARLRERKGRGAKPFAVMVHDLAVARAMVHVDAESEGLLTSAAAPIVVLPARPSAHAVAESIAPGSDVIGVMLPYSPLHALFMDALPSHIDCVVLTSGNLADEPICTDESEAEVRLLEVADGFLHHDRPIYAPCDDSVIRPVVGPIRRSRGYVPLPIALPFESRPLLAVGGELKATGGVSRGRYAWLTQHVGDIGSVETAQALTIALDLAADLAQVTPEAVVADLHPGYLSQRWARERSALLGVPLLLVQHHHAHLASLLAEHQVPPDEQVLGFTFDGTGYGLDETIWGGELLLGTYGAVERVGRLRPILLPGGDAATKRPPRVAMAHLYAAGLDTNAAHTNDDEARVVGQLLASGASCVPTTSIGRLFDAVSSLLDVCQDVTYEGQAAIELEALARTAEGAEPSFEFAIDTTPDGIVLDPAPLLTALLDHVRAGAPPAAAARSFHDALVAAMVEAAVAVRSRTGVATVGLTGGVFGNELLVRGAVSALGAAGFTVLTHQRVPANDGGLALGQLAVAACGGHVTSTIPAEGN